MFWNRKGQKAEKVQRAASTSEAIEAILAGIPTAEDGVSCDIRDVQKMLEENPHLLPKPEPEPQPEPEPIPDVEVDIEHLDIASIERTDDDETVMSFRYMKDGDPQWDDAHFATTVAQHNALVTRFRKKLGIIPPEQK